MSSSIDKQLETIRIKKQNILKEISKEKELLQYLKRTDGSWSKFINKNILKKTNAKDIEFSKDKYIELMNEKSDLNFIKKIQEKTKNIPTSNGSKYYNKLSVNIGVICDRDFYETFKDTANLFILNSDYIYNDLESLHILIISNFNEDICGNWSQFDIEEKRTISILKLIKDVKKLNKPVVFYDHRKEISIDKLPIIQSCDVIYTTVGRKLKFYEGIGINDVKVDSYAINPIKYNPIGSFLYKDDTKVLYHGAWDDNQDTLEEILDGVINSDKELKIIDPTDYSSVSIEKYYPLDYLSYIYPLKNINLSLDIHKLFDFSIAYNDIEKVFKLQAIGNVVISNYHPYINNNFPNVFTVDSLFETLSILNTLTEQDIRNIQLQGIRNIMSKELSFDKMERVLSDCGVIKTSRQRKVLVIGEEISRKQFENQTYKNADFINYNKLTPDLLKKYDFITFFNPNYYYEEYYLEDLINGFKYTNSDFVSKCEKTQEIKPFSYSKEIKDIYKTMFYVDSFTYKEISQQKIKPSKEIQGFYIDEMEVIDKPNLNHVKRKNPSKEKKLSVIVPIYNNGKFLKYKCFMSLKRSSIFKDMDIILVDDGSTDFETKIIVDRIHRSYDNVKLFKFKDNGSGSASRPRNKGIELSTSKYITYLDPDNEAINDGYARLLEEITNDESLDLVVGNITRYDSEVEKKEINYYNAAIKATGTDTINNLRKLLIDTNLKVQSIQALVVKKDIIEQNNIKMVESAAGQDTLFFQELLMKANKLKVVDLNIHVYYAAVENSVTNTVTSKFYEKYYKVEKERIKFLQRNNLFETYIEKKFQFYFVSWYLKKLTNLKKGHEEQSIKILKKIYDMYAPYLKDEKVVLKQFKKYYDKEDYEGFVKYCRSYFNC